MSKELGATIVILIVILLMILMFQPTTGSTSATRETYPHLFGIADTPQALLVIGEYQAVDFNFELGDNSGFGAIDSNCIYPLEQGHYKADFEVQFDDMSPNPASTIAIRISQNGEEISGSYVEYDISRQNATGYLTSFVYIEADVNDVICMEWTASDIDVQINSHELYADQPVVAKGFINWVHPD